MKDATPLRQRFRAEPLGGPRQRTNCPSALTTPSVPDMRVSPVTTHLSPVDKILLVLEEIGAEYKDLQKPQAQAVLNKLYFKCKIVQYGTHGEIVAYYSSELVDRLDSRWHGTPFWNWLVAESLKPNKKLVNSTVESIPSQLERRRKKPDTSSPASTTPASTQFEDARVPDPARHQGKRPGDVYAGTGGLRPPGSALKRSFSELDEESASGSGRSRRPARQSNVANYHSDGFMELDVDKAKGAEEDAGLQAKGNGQDIKVDKASQGDHGFLPPFPKDAVPIVFNAFREPATQPTGPNGTWVCEQELCGFVVRDAEVEAGLEKIRRHFRDHEHESERLELARAEALRGHQSIKYVYFPPFLFLFRIHERRSRPTYREKALRQGETVAGTGSEVARILQTPAPVELALQSHYQADGACLDASRAGSGAVSS